MNSKKKILQILVSCFLLFQIFACNKQPYQADYKNVAGYVIGKEICNTVDSNDYWLIDLSYYPNTLEYGDTLFFNGTLYNNVVKTQGLDDKLKQIGKIVSIDFYTISDTKVTTSGCNVANPETYDLKEIYVLHLFEIK